MKRKKYYNKQGKRVYLYQLDICRICHKKSKYYVKDGKYKRCRGCNTKMMRKYIESDPKNKQTLYKAVYASIKRHQVKQNARVLLNYHVNAGNIKRLPCKCGNPKSEGHHTDYSKPLKVKWLCRTCHFDIHRKEKAKSLQQKRKIVKCNR